MKELTVIVHSVEEDGLPELDQPGRVAFISEDRILSGLPIPQHVADTYINWCLSMPLNPERLPRWVKPGDTLWQTDAEVNRYPFPGITHWVEFPAAVWELTK